MKPSHEVRVYSNEFSNWLKFQPFDSPINVAWSIYLSLKIKAETKLNSGFDEKCWQNVDEIVRLPDKGAGSLPAGSRRKWGINGSKAELGWLRKLHRLSWLEEEDPPRELTQF